MKKTFISIIVLIMLILSYWSWQHQALAREKRAAKPPQAIAVSAATVIRKSVDVDAHVIGTVTAHQTVDIRSQVGGQLLKVYFKEGDSVKQGQKLFQIDPEPFETALAQVQANLAKDQATDLNAKTQANRAELLIKQGVISQQEYDQLKATAASAMAMVKADQAAVLKAKLDVQYALISAPIEGKTGQLQVDEGNVVQANSATPLVTINQIQPIYVSFSLPEQDLARIQQVNAKGSVAVQARYRGKTIAVGKLDFIDNQINADTGTIKLKALFSNQDMKLWPGQFVTVHLPLETIRNALLVPTRAIQIGPQGSYVYIIGEDNKILMQEVTTGPAIGTNKVVTKGLRVGQRVVTEGQLKLTQGSIVRVTTENSQ